MRFLTEKAKRPLNTAHKYTLTRELFDPARNKIFVGKAVEHLLHRVKMRFEGREPKNFVENNVGYFRRSSKMVRVRSEISLGEIVSNISQVEIKTKMILKLTIRRRPASTSTKEKIIEVVSGLSWLVCTRIWNAPWEASSSRPSQLLLQMNWRIEKQKTLGLRKSRLVQPWRAVLVPESVNETQKHNATFDLDVFCQGARKPFSTPQKLVQLGAGNTRRELAILHESAYPVEGISQEISKTIITGVLNENEPLLRIRFAAFCLPADPRKKQEEKQKRNTAFEVYTQRCLHRRQGIHEFRKTFCGKLSSTDWVKGT
ncbi:hypothetical protein C8R45DRAFT_924280 [Mycena sanguinolenta]|nr:hypothetical protein C8R45DRAFT_924280 [Mycena sanguinolenta]